jgi:chemotaxis protein methyltransferase CheR
MKPEDFELFSTMVRQRSGLLLSPDKAYLLESRLVPVARKWNLKTLEEIAQSLRAHRDEALMHDITEAMTTNETFFFRDQKPFEQFKNVVMPRLIKARESKKQVRIWSAASSSGQEAYSLAMIFCEESSKYHGWKIEIIGTDISSDIVERAKRGVYSQFEVQRGLPITLLVKYFTQIGTDKWQIKDNIRQMVQFREGNLITDFGAIGVFDVIFCRNVLIYFDQSMKTRVLEAMARILQPDGVLFLGGAETVLGITNKLKPLEGERGLYVLEGKSGWTDSAAVRTGVVSTGTAASVHAGA